MEICKSDFFLETTQMGIPTDKAERLWLAMQGHESNVSRSRFDLPNVLYYFGGSIAVFALGWILIWGWKEFGSIGELALALSYITILVFLGKKLWAKESTKTPGGIFIVLAVSLIPAVVYNLQQITGLGMDLKYEARWLPSEVATVIGGVLALRWFRFSFLAAPIFFALLKMSLGVCSLFFDSLIWEELLWVPMSFGLGILFIAYLIDQRTEADYAFWGYLFGTCGFWISLTVMSYINTGWERADYCLINIGLILLSVLLDRRVFVICGSLGVLFYLMMHFFKYFFDSMLFPVFLSVIGIAIIYLGMVYYRNEIKLQEYFRSYLSQRLISLLPRSRRKSS